VSLLTPQNFRWNDTRRQVAEVGWDRAARELEAVLAEALSESRLDKIESRLEQLALIETAYGGSHALVNRLEDQIKGFQNSTSWRLTAPLRRLKMLFS